MKGFCVEIWGFRALGFKGVCVVLGFEGLGFRVLCCFLGGLGFRFFDVGRIGFRENPIGFEVLVEGSCHANVLYELERNVHFSRLLQGLSIFCRGFIGL